VTQETFIRLSEVQMEGVGKRWGDAWAVKDVSLSIRPGDFYTLLGPPRSGKTTLLKMLAGLIAPDAGRIVIDDQDVDRTPPSQRNVGMVFQQNSVWPHLSVFENVAFGLRTRGEPADLVAGMVKAALAQVELAGIEAQWPAELSRSQ
jgi:ABC-type Fe3+/spermidine/putrescine transport system ATPase subunit